MKIICIGRNYANHIAELANERPESPVVFLKPDSAILPNKNPFFIPPFSDDVHYEVEVLVKINKVGKHIETKFAHKYYDEIGLGIDFTARDVQAKCKEKGLPWEKAKAFDGSAVVGDFYSKDEFDLENISFQLDKNGSIVQDGNTSSMLWKIDELISYVSQYFTLKKGDILYTGTPAGVGRVEEDDVLTGIIAGKQAFQIRVK
jgi:2-keto-4-pentenoate hydratase/2-oxohepta-3-ene-1,7-dioic acid hydratase in catechol pathway|uniref:fumarylacetoacetate hydrolase family protein n=1 Tax=Polaribacter sp. TaxID=1920175 RepID=UPI004048D1FA